MHDGGKSKIEFLNVLSSVKKRKFAGVARFGAEKQQRNWIKSKISRRVAKAQRNGRRIEKVVIGREELD